MRSRLIKLLRIQVVLMLVVLVAALVLGQTFYLKGLAAGSLMAITTTIMAMLIFRRLPKVAPARVFYAAMMLNEMMKWLLVIVLSALLSQVVPPIGLAIGFIITYLAYFWLILVD